MEKKTFILIHGSWHSAWNWHKVTPLLEKDGHRVLAIDLPGMGRDKTPVQHVTMELVSLTCFRHYLSYNVSAFDVAGFRRT